jgi:hypothetical protein
MTQVMFQVVNGVACPAPNVTLPDLPPPQPNPLPLPKYDSEVIYRCTDAGDRIRIVHQWLDTNTTGIPENTTALNLSTGAAFPVASINTLVNCPDNDFESDPVAWCLNGVNYSQLVVKKNGIPNGVVYWQNDDTGVASLVKPAGILKGACVISNNVNVTGSALPQIAGAGLSASNPNFAGQPDTVDTGLIAGDLLSVTVTAAGVTNGQSSPNRIEVDMPDGTIAYLLNGETKEFNLSRGQEQTLRREYKIRAIGNAYANIHGTFA